MRYYLDNGVVVDSDNTAKSYKQPARATIAYIESLENVDNIMDYGCGKLRYSLYLKNKCETLTLVDSGRQLSKVQKIHDYKTSIVDFVNTSLQNTRAINPDQLFEDEVLYDFVFCSNVLSAIPSEEARNEVLQNILGKLKKDGEAIFITQYANSFYNKKEKNNNAQKYFDGWLTNKNFKGTYYGLLNKKKLTEILMNAGFDIVKSWTVDQSVFVNVKRINYLDC